MKRMIKEMTKSHVFIEDFLAGIQGDQLATNFFSKPPFKPINLLR